jgi:hypothetical protein
MRLSYILPIKWDGGEDTDELTGYLAAIASHVELIIVDGSNTSNFNRHHEAWANFGRHLPPAAAFKFINGKVNGVMTGLQLAQHDKVIIADDDVRYTVAQLETLAALLDDVHLIVPQNYFAPNPWHAQWDTARSLLNRALHHDYPGTLAVQRDFINQLGGYDGNVLFENLELMRTIKAGGGKVLYKPDMFVERLPPSAKHFWSQRVRQAYDDYAQPFKLAFFFLLMPGLSAAAVVSPLLPAGLLALSIPVAEAGRRLHGGSKFFPLSSSFYAPCWLLERGICTWLAMFAKLRNGGVRYNGKIISIAANPIWKLRSKLSARQLVNSISV